MLPVNTSPLLFASGGLTGPAFLAGIVPRPDTVGVNAERLKLPAGDLARALVGGPAAVATPRARFIADNPRAVTLCRTLYLCPLMPCHIPGLAALAARYQRR